ncbi:hypothetical protein LUW77_08440 [Streptomyces radiopugnans]|nr:hypothetical protein LUW77_08440 [Streptomyces radiopugnans]
MEPAGSLTGGRRPSPGGLWLASPVLVAACAALAALSVTAPARAAVAWCGAAATLAMAAAAYEVVRRGRAVTAARQRAERQLADLEHYCLEVMPPVVEAVQRGEAPGDVLPPSLHPADSDPRLVAAHEKLTNTVVRAVQDREFQRDSARRAIVNIACRIQAEIHRLQADLRRMQFKHPAPEILGDLMHLEHGVNVAYRVATSLAVLGGGSPARQWQKPVSLYDVLRAGSAPIAEYLRIELHRIAEVAVLGPAVEPLSLVFSELMDNAARYSPPSTKVVVNTEEVASGIEVSIEDKGVGLTEETRLSTPSSCSPRRRTGWTWRTSGRRPVWACGWRAYWRAASGCGSPCVPPPATGCARSSSSRTTCSPRCPWRPTPGSAAVPPARWPGGTPWPDRPRPRLRPRSGPRPGRTRRANRSSSSGTPTDCPSAAATAPPSPRPSPVGPA